MQSAPPPDLLTRLEREDDVRRVPFPHGHIAWHGFGEGPPLVLLHGGHGSWLHWARNIPVLARSHRVWAADLPGYGLSDTPAEPTMDSLISATVHTLDALVGAGQPVRVAGFSFGGFAGARLAQARGGVTHLAMFGPGGSKTPRHPRGQLSPWRDLPVGSAEFHAVMRNNLLLHMLHEPDAIDDTALAIHEQSCLTARFPSKRISLAGGLPDALRGSTARVLLMSGEHDVTVTPDDLAKLVLEVRPDARTVTIPGVGHWIQYEAADVVNETLSDWLSQG